MEKEISSILPSLPELNVARVTNFVTKISWGIKNPERFGELMTEMLQLVSPGFHMSDNFFAWFRNMSMFSDEAFLQAWRGNMQNDIDEAIVWRRYILATSAFHCVQLGGDFVECGCLNGTGIKTVMDYLGGKDFPRPFWGYDTFDYHPVEGMAFSMQKEGLYEKVCERFAEYKQVRLIQGLIPDSFNDGVPEKIAYLHIDLNSAEAEMATLDCLFDRVVAGGMVILDDYEWCGAYRAQKAAQDPWFDARGYRVMPLPTGQGLVIKR